MHSILNCVELVSRNKHFQSVQYLSVASHAEGHCRAGSAIFHLDMKCLWFLYCISEKHDTRSLVPLSLSVSENELCHERVYAPCHDEIRV